MERSAERSARKKLGSLTRSTLHSLDPLADPRPTPHESPPMVPLIPIRIVGSVGLSKSRRARQDTHDPATRHRMR